MDVELPCVKQSLAWEKRERAHEALELVHLRRYSQQMNLSRKPTLRLPIVAQLLELLKDELLRVVK